MENIKVMDDAFFSIYVHIPFCRRKCNYCSFYSLTDLSLIELYLKSLGIELSIYKDEITNRKSVYKTIYFGGGTPSVFNASEMEKLLSLFNSICELKNLDECSFELNPESITEEKLKILKEYGINRISIGLETTNNELLKFLGRINSYEEFLKSYDLIRKYFDNINLDLIYGIGNESYEQLLSDLKEIIKLNPTHISAYCLERNSNKWFDNIKIDEERQADFYLTIIDFLSSKRYIHYEISNFAKDRMFSKHNLNYWNRGEYIGFGPSASSHLNNLRWKNKSDIRSYITALNNGKIEFEYMERMKLKDILNEKLMLGLRKITGVDFDLYLKFKERIDEEIKKGYMEIYGDRVRIKKDYLFVSNKIISEIIYL